MKKFILCLTTALITATSAQAQYVRKVVRPNFFIPEQEFNRAEKLPPFPQYENEYDKDINYVIPAKQKQRQKIKKVQPATETQAVNVQTSPQEKIESTQTDIQSTTTAKQEPTQLMRWNLYQEEQSQSVENKVDSSVAMQPSQKLDLPVVDERVLPDMSTAKVDDNFEQTDEYKQIAQEYANDINTLAQSGQLPENKNISDALSKMISDDAVWVDENFGK